MRKKSSDSLEPARRAYIYIHGRRDRKGRREAARRKREKDCLAWGGRSGVEESNGKRWNEEKEEYRKRERDRTKRKKVRVEKERREEDGLTWRR